MSVSMRQRFSRKTAGSAARASACSLLLFSLLGQAPLSAQSPADAESSASAAAQPSRAPVENLGRPFAEAGAYAQNIWDMQLWNGKIYIGQGNSSNYGSSPNAGPVPVRAYDPASGRFVSDQISKADGSLTDRIPEEQIDVFKTLNGRLYIPGHDTTVVGSKTSSFYVLGDKGPWTQTTSVPNAVHVYDMAAYHGYLFAATGSNGSSPPQILMSADRGKSWAPQGVPSYWGAARNFTLFPLNGKLYALSQLLAQPDGGIAKGYGVLEIREDASTPNGIAASRSDVAASALFPGIDPPAGSVSPTLIRMARPTPAGSRLIYIGAETHNDHQWLPKGLFVASSIKQAAPIGLPGGASAMDILVRGDKAYVLAYTQTGNTYTNLVFEADVSSVADADAWKEVVRFRQNTFARSFELQDGDFYFGLGTHDEKTPTATTGSILRIRDVVK
ncbi:hypothetical protein [Saccharibacillus alkalitolerans]|uniref:Uncharacterized protein n=1 Tax=Saccharibacillus alkalitolerans TaxID=2705290 RepID=A0ABX0F4W8_9BACL|nr:hypothetical protein [Saccharibacillus alkalitolerans]NGZ74940.1 hypothetical protein [Saccharibacillus alkalitolerans]